MRFLLATSFIFLAVLTRAAIQPDTKTGISIPLTKRANKLAGVWRNAVDREVHIEFVKAKIRRGLHNFKRNTRSAHSWGSEDIQLRRTAAGSDPLTDYEDELWYGPVSIGTPEKTFNVLFDTGSSDFLVPGINCTENCAGHQIYDPSASSTSKDLHRNVSLYFGSGASSACALYTDSITVVGLTASSQTLGAASAYSSDMAKGNFPADGIMGMAFQPMSFFNATPLFQTLISQGQVAEPVFAFKLASPGELFLGGVNPALYTGDFSYVPVTTASYWQVSMDSIVANGQEILSNIGCIIDTGTTLVIGDPTSVDKLYNKLGGVQTIRPGFYAFLCDKFPSISFNFGGREFSLSADSLNLGPDIQNSSYCDSALIAQDTGIGLWVVGDVFLQNVYTKFDIGNLRVGFASLA